MPTNPSPENPRGLTGAALTQWRRSEANRRPDQGRDNTADSAAEPAASGDAAEVSHDGGADQDQDRQNSESDRRDAQLRAEHQETVDDFAQCVTHLDNLLETCRKNFEDKRSMTDLILKRRIGQANMLHQEASDALQVWYEVSVDIADGDAEKVDPEYTKRHATINSIWEAIEHTLHRHLEVRPVQYEHPHRAGSYGRSPSVRARDPGPGASMGRSGGDDAAAPNHSSGVRFGQARVRQGPLERSYGNNGGDQDQRHDFEFTRSARRSDARYDTPDERARRHREQQEADARAREEDSARFDHRAGVGSIGRDVGCRIRTRCQQSSRRRVGGGLAGSDRFRHHPGG